MLSVPLVNSDGIFRRREPEKGKDDVGRTEQTRGSRALEWSSTYLLTRKKFPTRHSNEGTVEAMET